MRRLGKYALVFFALLLACPLSHAGNKALLIGISQYADPEINDLAYADEDVKTFASILQNFADYRESDISILLNDKATKQSITSSIVEIVKDSQKNPMDLFLLMYAGHGLPPNIESNRTNSFLAPHDAFLNQFFPEGTGALLGNETFINKAWLIRQLSSINAKDIVIILDSCYSGAKNFGELYAENLGFYAQFVAGAGGKRNIVVVSKKGAGGPMDRRIAFLASSRENQPSAEYGELRHGALSYTMFEYLNAIRKETEMGLPKEVTVEGMYSGISQLFDTVKVRGEPLSQVHQPVLFPIPNYDAVKDMRLVAIRGIKMPEPKPVEKPREEPPVEPPKAEPPKAVAAPPEIRPETKPEPVQPVKKTGEIYIDTGAEECEVSIDGARTGRSSNSAFELGEGKHLVSLYLPKTNYNRTIMVDVRAGGKERIEVAFRGNLKVESRPPTPGEKVPELEVYVDNRHVGRTPLELRDLVAGTHMLKVTVNKTIKKRKIEIRPESPLLVRYKIIKKPVRVRPDDTGAGDVTF